MCTLCLHVYMCTVCVYCPKKSDEDIGSPQIRVTDNCMLVLGTKPEFFARIASFFFQLLSHLSSQPLCPPPHLKLMLYRDYLVFLLGRFLTPY